MKRIIKGNKLNEVLSKSSEDKLAGVVKSLTFSGDSRVVTVHVESLEVEGVFKARVLEKGVDFDQVEVHEAVRHPGYTT